MCSYSDLPRRMQNSRRSTDPTTLNMPTSSFSHMQLPQASRRETQWHSGPAQTLPSVSPCHQSCEVKYARLRQRLDEVLEDNTRISTLLENAQLEIKQLQSEREHLLGQLHHSGPSAIEDDTHLSPSYLSSSLTSPPLFAATHMALANDRGSNHSTSPAPSTAQTAVSNRSAGQMPPYSALSVESLLAADENSKNPTAAFALSRELADAKQFSVYSRTSFAEHSTTCPQPMDNGNRQQCTLPSLRQYMHESSLHLLRKQGQPVASSAPNAAAALLPCPRPAYPLHLPPQKSPPDHMDDGHFYMYRDNHHVQQMHHNAAAAASSREECHNEQQDAYQPQPHPRQPSASDDVNSRGISSNSRRKNPHDLLSDGNASVGSSVDTEVRPPGKRRKRHHDIASKIRSVQPVPRDRDGNYEMPVQVGILTVLRLGRVVWDRDAYHNERYIWPVGYTVQREYYSMADPNKSVIYTCWITDGGDVPMFHVEAEDMPGAPIIAPTATGAWTAVLRTVNQIRHREHSNSASGPDYFGFSHPTIAKMIQDLPGADKCKAYIVQHFVEMKERHVRGVIKKGRGGRPSLDMLSRGQRALLATASSQPLASSAMQESAEALPTSDRNAVPNTV
ncbi:hypothetical protein EV178_003882 [Coemansia sp. RSA 1646]|nr:hypothetical protein EV178_003882 [Coemansia sp. RSA 1646]